MIGGAPRKNRLSQEYKRFKRDQSNESQSRSKSKDSDHLSFSKFYTRNISKKTTANKTKELY